ncbi:TPA: GPW/gp25 family protein [Vibrio parahaemolyticus]|nr:GPW/gp25 family protein [Vibrio parahaemolyticus]HCE4648055.1 GPW/gp25 family protein [Vibrio parahaemolyticus]HCH0981682.1 GPW/gp25 family protein [Vibrio parahaemolyticus]
MQGMNAQTGVVLSGVSHLRQSVLNILTTPLGSRVYRREYGSRLFDLIDQPTNEAWAVEVYAATAEALARWEPRIRLKRVQVYRQDNGYMLIDLEGEYLVNGESILLDGLQVG